MNTPRRSPNRNLTPIPISPGSVGLGSMPTPPWWTAFRNNPFERRQGTGSEQSGRTAGNHASPTESSTSEASSSAEREDSDTTRSWSPSPRRRLWPSSSESSTESDTGSQPDPPQPTTTSGNSTPEWESIFD